MLTIWGRLNSHNVKKVVWAAGEAGIAWQRRDMGGSFGYTPAYLAHNPNHLVPMIEEADGFTLWESNAILRYLASAHAPHLWAGDARQKARADKWLDWQFAFADAQRDGFLQLVRVAEAQRDAAKIAATAAATGRLMAMAEAELARQPFLSGAEFGIADIAMGTYAHTWFTLGFDRAEGGEKAEVPHVRAWHAALIARPAFAAIAIPLS
ncbi:MAG TPA: glutathione S-transferase family protein [Novosphingobium sp.]|nr:glutathione S-transferase family protein [Novosphingobium sp.]